jgi:hypothetical protein
VRGRLFQASGFAGGRWLGGIWPSPLLKHYQFVYNGRKRGKAWLQSLVDLPVS